MRWSSALVLSVASLGCGPGDPAEADTGTSPEHAVQLSVGQDFACATLSSGRAVCWGGAQGILPVFGSGPYVFVGAAAFHAIAIRPDGSMDCAGREDMCLGLPDGGVWTKADGHGHHSLALREDGEVFGWGEGDATADALGGTWVDVAAGHDVSCLLDASGHADCWYATPPEATFTQVDAEWQHACGLTDAGEILCWSHEYYEVDPCILEVPEGRFLDVGTGHTNTCAVLEGGSLRCWGRYEALSEVPPGTFIEVDAGYGYACALDSEGWVECWGAAGFDGSTDISPPWQAR